MPGKRDIIALLPAGLEATVAAGHTARDTPAVGEGTVALGTPCSLTHCRLMWAVVKC